MLFYPCGVEGEKELEGGKGACGLETAKQHFQHLLDHGGTHIQEQIATNRLREIAAKQKALSTPSPATSPTRQRAKARARAKR